MPIKLSHVYHLYNIDFIFQKFDKKVEEKKLLKARKKRVVWSTSETTSNRQKNCKKQLKNCHIIDKQDWKSFLGE